VLDGVMEAVARPSATRGLVIWHEAAVLPVGANLAQRGAEPCRPAVRRCSRRPWPLPADEPDAQVRQVPVVAAVQGMALGGGCEFVMHASAPWRRWSYIGLVEAGVGLIPAGGGCKEFAVRASAAAGAPRRRRRLPLPAAMFQTVAMANVSKSALEARELGFLRESDDIVFNAHELLHVARHRARAWRKPATRRRCRRAHDGGRRNGIATCEMMLVNMKEGGFISAHDYRVARARPPRCAAARSRPIRW
jgi:3-hydroxyacyl-CoA dehydrogenase